MTPVISGGQPIEEGHQRIRRASAAIVASDAAGGMFAWQNPEERAIFVLRAIVDVTTPATGACTMNLGTAADGTTASDNLIDGLDVGAAAILGDNQQTPGVNGEAIQRVDANGGATDFVTGSVATGASAGIVGRVQLHYVLADD